MRVDSTLNLQNRVFLFLPVIHTRVSSYSHLSPCFLVYLFTCFRVYCLTSFNHPLNSLESIFSSALPQRSIAQPQKSKSIFDIFAWIAAHKPQPTSDMIIFSFIRAILLEETAPKYAAHTSLICSSLNCIS